MLVGQVPTGLVSSQGAPKPGVSSNISDISLPVKIK